MVIAHRLSTLEKADNIIVIVKGCVAEQGSHSQLMTSRGLYHKLVQRQLLGIDSSLEDQSAPEKHCRESERTRHKRRQSSSSESDSNLHF